MMFCRRLRRCCRHSQVLLLACMLLSRAHAFYVTPWTRIHHGHLHNKKNEVQHHRVHANLLLPPHATTSSSSSSRQQKTIRERPNNNLAQLERDVVHLGRRGKTQQALDLYNSVTRPTVRLMNGAIDACARARPPRLDQAFELLQEGVSTKHLKPNVFTFGALMSACARARRADRALRLLQSMEDDYGVRPNAVVYSTAISACARADPPQPEQARELLRKAPSEMSVVGYNAALSACAMAGQWGPALELLQEMQSAESLVQPDEVSYGTVLAACERGQQWNLVLELAKEMQQTTSSQKKNDAITLDGMAVTSVLHACQQLGLAKEALQYLELMKTLSAPTERKTAGWQRSGVKSPIRGADAVAYRLAISACARGGQWQEGIRLLDEMRNVTGTSPDIMAYTSAITGCEYAGEWKKAFSLVDAMRKDGVEPNVVTFAAVIGACATACAKATSSSRPSNDEEEEDDAITGMKAVNKPKTKALRLLRVMKKDPTVVDPNIVVYNAAIRVCAEALDLDGALGLMKELEADGLVPTVVTFGSLMTACERVGNIEGASKVFRRMRESSIDPNEIIYGAAISCCRKAGDPERTLLLLRKMIREGLTPNAATFNTVIVAQTEGKTKDLERAILVYKLMKSKYAPPHARPNRQTYNLLIRALASKQRPQEAELFLRKMQVDGFVPDVDLYTATVTAYERTRQPLKALRLMESMSEDGYDFYEVKVLDAVFKKAIEMASVVGRGLGTTTEERQIHIKEQEDEEGDASFQLDVDDGEDEEFINGR